VADGVKAEDSDTARRQIGWIRQRRWVKGFPVLGLVKTYSRKAAMIKAIETIYKGYRFRSRLEARWAVFFDALGIPWEYEKEGFNINGKYYLPDFYLPEIDTYIEIKPASKDEPDEWPDHPYDAILRELGYTALDDLPQLIIIKGNPWVNPDDESDFEYCGFIPGDYMYYFCECPSCGKIGIQFEGRAARICGSKCLPDSDKSYNTHSERLLAAYLKARQARFEHGETP
jgi:hypothetical protein